MPAFCRFFFCVLCVICVARILGGHRKLAPPGLGSQPRLMRRFRMAEGLNQLVCVCVCVCFAGVV